MDAESFKKQFLPCYAKLYRIAVRLLDNTYDAEDIVQEAYLKLWNKRDELKDIKNPESFCVTVIKNLCFDHLRNSKSYTNSFEDINNEPSKLSVAKEIEDKDEMGYIHNLIGNLPPQQKKVMQLRHVSECSLEEIEYITGLTPVNIRSILSRARKKIREHFEKVI